MRCPRRLMTTPVVECSNMNWTMSHRSKALHFKRMKSLMSSVKGVTHFSRRDKRRLHCRLQFWIWRKWQEKYRLGIFRSRKLMCGMSPHSGPCFSLKTHTKKKKRRLLTSDLGNSQVTASVLESPLGPGTGVSQTTVRQQTNLLNPSEVSTDSSSSQDPVMDTDAAGLGSQTTLTATAPERCGQITDISERCDVVKRLRRANSGAGRVTTNSKQPNTVDRLEFDDRSGRYSAVTLGSQSLTVNGDTQEQITTKTSGSAQTDVNLKALAKDTHEFLDDFYGKYGSFIPLQKSDILRHLKKKFKVDLNDRTNIIFSEVARYRSTMVKKPIPSFQVVYKKHTLTLDDLSTLANQNWLNDQVMNMYGELIMECAHHKVHFLNSFFHRQLMTKGYDGVKRWTKQVDLFSKTLILVPVHLEVHWCLVTADIPKKKICLYDSQGNALQKVARNILRYLITEAKEKKKTAFESGWMVSFDEKVPQQTNENDCGVFVLEYSRCLALMKPLQFSQKDIPNIRKRIYKELCDCKLHEQG